MTESLDKALQELEQLVAEEAASSDTGEDLPEYDPLPEDDDDVSVTFLAGPAVKWDPSKHPRDKEGQFTDTVGTIRGVVRTTAEQARRDLVALGKKVEQLDHRHAKAAEESRVAWAAFMKDARERKRPLKIDGAAAKKLPSYKAAQAADAKVIAISEETSRVAREVNKEALRQLVVPERERSLVEFLVPEGQLNPDPRIEAGIGDHAKRALDVFRKYDGSGELMGVPIPPGKEEQFKEIFGDVEFEHLPDGSTWVTKKLRLTRAPAGARANASAFGVQIGGTRELERTIYHEVAHHVEFANSDIYQAAVDLRASLASESTPKSLNDLKGVGGYGPEEIALPGKFLDSYVGKVYPEDARATEMLSTGMEYYLTDPIRFAREAPEHFKFVWNVMHGKYRRK